MPIKASYSFTTLTNLSALVQYNGQTGQFSSNIRLALLNRSGTGLFVVYNDRRDTLLVHVARDARPLVRREVHQARRLLTGHQAIGPTIEAPSAETTIGMTPPAAIFIASKASARRAVDPDVRALLREYLEELHRGTDARVLEELGLCQGDVRVDVAAVNDELSGYEIKSPSDTLLRFPNQCRIYSKVVDRAWLVAPEKTLAKAEAPEWWGQIAVFDAGDRLGLRVVRAAQRNPKCDPLSIARLLWRDEALEVLRGAGRVRGVMTKSRKIVWKRLIESVALDDLRAAVRAALKRRPEMIALTRRK